MSLLMRSCVGCDCGTTGHKAIVAQKSWHGRFPFSRESCLADADLSGTPPDTKYLVKTIDADIDGTATVAETKFVYADPNDCESGEETELENASSFSDIRKSIATVGRYTGVITVTDCEVSRDVDFPAVPDIDVDPNLVFWPDILCGGTTPFRLPWIDILCGLDACDGIIYHAIGGSCGQSNFPNGTPTEIEDHFTESLDDGLGNTRDVTCSVTLTSTTIEVTITSEYTSAGSGDDSCGNPFSYTGSGSSTAHVLITLSSAYTATQVNADVETLLATRDLTNHTHYTWHHGCVYPFVFYDEPTARTPDDYSPVAEISDDGLTLDSEPCAWEDTYATEGGHADAGYTGDVINGSGAVTEWYWIAPGFLPGGAFKDFSSGILVACKYAEILKTRLAHNWFRPCGDDRLLPDDCAGFLYPTAWPICGVPTIEPAPGSGVPAVTGNAVSPIQITVSHSRAIVTGDLVDVSGVTGNTAANGSWTVTAVGSFYVVDDIPYQDLELDGSTGNGAYISGGEVRNAASLTPPDAWDDDTAKGDYLYLHYAFEQREIALDPTIRQYNNEYGMPQRVKTLTVTAGNLDFSASPRVVSISPDGSETWTNGDSYAFDGAAMPLPCDERFGALWCGQVQQRMPDPIDHLTTVEARASVPVGAPALPVITPGCCGVSASPYCPFVHIMSIAEITALGTGGVPTGLVSPPLFTCAAFDDDP